MSEAMLRELADEFKSLFDRADKDQWRLAELTYLAIEEQGSTIRAFADMVGRSRSAIGSYRKVWEWRIQNNVSSIEDMTYSDARELARVGEPADMAALHAVADLYGISISTAAKQSADVDYYREVFANADHETLVAALGDEDVRAKLTDVQVDVLRKDITTTTKKAGTGTTKPLPDRREYVARRELDKVKADMMHFASRTAKDANRLAADFTQALPSPYWNNPVDGTHNYKLDSEVVIKDLEHAEAALGNLRRQLVLVLDQQAEQYTSA